MCVLLQVCVFCYRCVCFVTGVCVLLQVCVFCYRCVCFVTGVCVLLQVCVFCYRCVCFVTVVHHIVQGLECIALVTLVGFGVTAILHNFTGATTSNVDCFNSLVSFLGISGGKCSLNTHGGSVRLSVCLFVFICCCLFVCTSTLVGCHEKQHHSQFCYILLITCIFSFFRIYL